jgi:hypothetical protein
MGNLRGVYRKSGEMLQPLAPMDRRPYFHEFPDQVRVGHRPPIQWPLPNWRQQLRVPRTHRPHRRYLESPVGRARGFR